MSDTDNLEGMAEQNPIEFTSEGVTIPPNAPTAPVERHSDPSPDTQYQLTHDLIAKARGLLEDSDVDNAVAGMFTVLIHALEESVFGWGSLGFRKKAEDDFDDGWVPPVGVPRARRPRVPDMATLVLHQKNAVAALNEWAQQAEQELPTYLYKGVGPFQATCLFMGHEISGQDLQRNKNMAKHDAAQQMLVYMRECRGNF